MHFGPGRCYNTVGHIASVCVCGVQVKRESGILLTKWSRLSSFAPKWLLVNLTLSCPFVFDLSVHVVAIQGRSIEARTYYVPPCSSTLPTVNFFYNKMLVAVVTVGKSCYFLITLYPCGQPGHAKCLRPNGELIRQKYFPRQWKFFCGWAHLIYWCVYLQINLVTRSSVSHC